MRTFTICFSIALLLVAAGCQSSPCRCQGLSDELVALSNTVHSLETRLSETETQMSTHVPTISSIARMLDDEINKPLIQTEMVGIADEGDAEQPAGELTN